MTDTMFIGMHIVGGFILLSIVGVLGYQLMLGILDLAR